jgi:hypothetical protein
MHVLRIEHDVPSYDEWRRAFVMRNPTARVAEIVESGQH